MYMGKTKVAAAFHLGSYFIRFGSSSKRKLG